METGIKDQKKLINDENIKKIKFLKEALFLKKKKNEDPVHLWPTHPLPSGF